MTSSERLKPCCATTWPDDVMSRVSRADDSSRKVCSGASTQGSSARISPADSRRRASRAGRDRRWRRGRRRRRAPGRRRQGAARMEPRSARSCTNAGGRRPAPSAVAHQPADQAAGERRRRAAVHAVHQLLGDDEAVAGRGDQRAADTGHAGDPVERARWVRHCDPLQPAACAARAARSATRTTRAIGSAGSRASRAGPSRRSAGPARSARRATRS